jgi:FAD:protein FMN transferase
MSIRFCFTILFLIPLMGSHHHQSHSTSLYTYTGKAQGTTYSIKYRSQFEWVSQSQIDSLFTVFDQSLSRYNPNSLLSKINSSRKSANLDSHLVELINFSHGLEAKTDATFSISILPLLKLWGFDRQKSATKPDAVLINKTLEITRNNSLTINGLRLTKSNPKTALDLDGIAQGYCVDYLSSFLMARGITHFIVEIGGEVYAHGTDSSGNPWRVAVQDPDFLMGVNLSEELILPLSGNAITTSGSYQKYVQFGDQYFSHIIDPRTGYPVDNNLVTVTVLAPKAILADGLDNAFMVMGMDATFRWLEKNPDIGVYMVYRDQNGQLSDTSNRYFRGKMIKGGNN